MHKHAKHLLIALTAAFALSLAASAANANRSIEVRGGPNVEASSRATFIGTELSRGFQIICDITLRRTVTSSIPKTAGTLFGKITGIRINRGGAGTGRSPNCQHGEIIREVHDIVPLIGPERPCTHSEDRAGNLTWDCTRAEARLWKLIYDGFQGTLPRIEGVNVHIQNIQLRIDLLGPFGETIRCLYEGNSFGLIDIRQPEGTATRARAEERRTAIPGIGITSPCPARATFRGEFEIRPTLTIALL
jgi:hypothetical protein